MTMRRLAACLTGASLTLVAVTGCGADDPESTPTSPPTSDPVITAPEPDPTEEAEDAAIAAVEAFYDTEEQAGRSGDWSEELWSQVAAGTALEDRLSLGADYTAAGWIFEGEIGVTDSTIDSLQLEPEPTVAVTSCIDRSTWISPDGPGNSSPALVTNTAAMIDEIWLVVSTVGNGAPCI